MIRRKFHIDFDKSQDHSISYLLGILEDARVTTIQRVKDLTVHELDWQYKEGWNTIGVLLSHIIANEHCFRIEFVEGRELTEEENSKWLPGMEMGKFIPQLINQKPVKYYIDEMFKSRQMLISELKKLTFEDFTQRKEGYDSETGCNLAWVLYHMAEDEVHHRGQISILLKLYKERN